MERLLKGHKRLLGAGWGLRIGGGLLKGAFSQGGELDPLDPLYVWDPPKHQSPPQCFRAVPEGALNWRGGNCTSGQVPSLLDVLRALKGVLNRWASSTPHVCKDLAVMESPIT
jgi:hypothetical protein